MTTPYIKLKNNFFVRIIFFICIAVIIALLVHNFLNLVVALGRHIPIRSIRVGHILLNKALPGPLLVKASITGWHNFPMQWLKVDYVYGLIWGVILGLSIFLWPVRPGDKKAIFIAWSVKLFVVLFLMLFYEWHYSCLDSYGYYNATFYNRSEWSSVGMRDAIITMANLIWVQQQVIPSFHAAKVSFAMVGLIAVYIFYRGVIIFLKQEKISLFYIFVFFPSILFWSSTLGKEPISLLGMALYFYGAVGWHCRRQLPYLLVLMFGMLLSAYIRTWFGLLLFLPFIVLFFLGLKKSGKILFLLLCANLIILFKPMVIKIFQYQSLEKMVSLANQMSYGLDGGGSGLGLYEKFSSVGQMLLFMPVGLFTAFFRPLPGEVHNLFGFLSGMENILILIILLLAIPRVRRADLKEPLFIWAILLILAWGSVYSFLAYNLGTISRYRLQILPILLVSILYLFRKRRTANES